MDTCLSSLSTLSTSPYLGLYHASSGSFNPVAITSFFMHPGDPNFLFHGNAFTTNAGMQMGNPDICNHMEYYALNYDDDVNLNPTFCSSSSIGAVCLPHACTGIPISDLQPHFANLASTAANTSEFKACQSSAIPNTTTPINEFIECAGPNANYLYFSNANYFLTAFGPAGMNSPLQCSPFTAPPLDTAALTWSIVATSILVLTLVASCLSSLARTPWCYFAEPDRSPSPLDPAREKLLDVTTEVTSESFISPEEDFVISKPLPYAVTAFDGYSHVADLFSFTRRKGPFACLDCFRAVSALWVLTGHSYLWQSFYVTNEFRMVSGPDSFAAHFLSNPLVTNSFTLSVDTFFYLSAFLAAYFLLKELHKHPHKSLLKIWVAKVVNRCVRIWPAFACVLFFTWKIVPLMDSETRGVDGALISGACEGDGWWHALLFVGNILPWSRRGSSNCFGHTWYLACDIQLFLLLPPVVMGYAAARNRDLASSNTGTRFLRGLWIVCLVLCIAGSCCYSFTMASKNGWSIFNNDPDNDYMKDYYALPWTRFPSYYLGVLTAVVWYEKEKEYPDFMLTRMTRNVVLCAAIGLVLVAVYGPYAGNLQVKCGVLTDDGLDCGSGYSVAARAAFVAFVRPCFVTGLSGLSLVCFNGQGGVVAGILESKAWLPLSLTSYCFYLVHPAILTLSLESESSMTTFNGMLWMFRFAGFVVVAFAAAALFHTGVEVPFGKLQKRYFWSY